MGRFGRLRYKAMGTKSQNTEGFVKISRGIMSWEWYNDINTTRLFIHCLLKANWQEKAWKGETIRRGQFVTSLSKLAEETGLTIRQTRTALSHLEKTGELTSQTNAKRRIITVNNYEKFQGATKQSPSNRQTTDKPEGNRATTTKEYIKNIKEEKESANAQFAPPGQEGQEQKVYLDDYYRKRDGG